MTEPTEERPLVTFALFAYNQERFIREAVEGALAQTYSPLQVILSDDCSSDRTFEIMRGMVTDYFGPHEILLNRNDINLGIPAHVNKVIELASGKIVVIAAGDDYSLPERVLRSYEVLSKNPDCFSVIFKKYDFKNESDKPLDINIDPQEPLEPLENFFSLEYLIKNSFFPFSGASIAFRRKVFEYFGPLHRNCQAEDGPIFIRCAILGKICIANDIQVLYRIHGDNVYSSDNKYKINFHLIHNQYVRDIEIALQKSFITEDLAYKLRELLQKKNYKISIQFGYMRSQQKIPYVFKYIINSNLFRVKDKLWYIKQSFLDHFK